jgi:Uncharacterized protein conserved in bacteria (DUF2330)
MAALRTAVAILLCLRLAAPPVALAVRESVTEEAVIELAPGRETITMRFVAGLGRSRSTWVMPVPSRADVTLGDGKLLDELNELSKPDYKDEYNVVIGDDDDVVYFRGKRQDNPYEVVQLDQSNAAEWLARNHFRQPIPYLAEGWTLVAVSPAGARPGTLLPPLRISFATDKPIYPTRLEKLAAEAAELRLHVLADHRMDALPLSPQFAGPVEARNRFLTTFTKPMSGVTSDVTFTRATTDDRYRAVLTRQNDIEIPVWAVTLATLAAIVLIALAARTLIRHRRKSD